jgi:hypothetical protein
MLDEIYGLWRDLDDEHGCNWGWCTLDKARLIMDLVKETCSSKENPICLEIGVYGGKSIQPFAAALKSIGRGQVYGIDPWSAHEAVAGYQGEHREFWASVDMDRMYDICLDGLRRLGVEDHVCLLKTTSELAPEISNICVIHLDGQHTEQVSSDVARWAPLVTDGGYFLVNDIDWSEDTRKAGPILESFGFYLHSRVGGCAAFRKGRPDAFAIGKSQRPRLWIVDDFYEDPHAVRDFALRQPFDEGGIGRGYIGRRTSGRFLFPGLKERFEQIIGMPITGWESHGMNGRFQVAWAGEPLVYHCDSQRFAGMLFLTPGAPFETGTTLYANRRNRARTFDDPGWDEAWKGGNHLDGTPFEPVDVAGNVFNRLVIFDGSCIHSASEYFGQDMSDGRLWHMFFFDA